MTSRPLAMAEIIIEFFDGVYVDQILKLEPKTTKNAFWVLTYLKLVRIENGKAVVTKRGEYFKGLPCSDEN